MVSRCLAAAAVLLIFDVAVTRADDARMSEMLARTTVTSTACGLDATGFEVLLERTQICAGWSPARFAAMRAEAKRMAPTIEPKCMLAPAAATAGYDALLSELKAQLAAKNCP